MAYIVTCLLLVLLAILLLQTLFSLQLGNLKLVFYNKSFFLFLEQNLCLKIALQMSLLFLYQSFSAVCQPSFRGEKSQNEVKHRQTNFESQSTLNWGQRDLGIPNFPIFFVAKGVAMHKNATKHYIISNFAALDLQNSRGASYKLQSNDFPTKIHNKKIWCFRVKIKGSSTLKKNKRELNLIFTECQMTTW